MASRIKDVAGSQTQFNPDLVLLVDKVDTGSNDWLAARKLELKYLGNAYFQGSSNGVNFFDTITLDHNFIRFSVDGGSTWKSLITDNVQEGNNLYFTEQRVLETPGVQDTIDDSHTHTNKTLLDSIIDNGDGNSFLADDGSYFNIFGPLTEGTLPVKAASGFEDSPVFVDGTSVKIGNSTNNVEFEEDGTLKFNGTSTYWLDVDFPIIIRTTGPNIPTLTTINGNLTLPEWAVNDYNMCESQEFIHPWKEGSTVYWHIHLTTNGTNVDNRYVRFEVEYGYVSPSGVWTFPATLDSGDLLIPANTATKTMMIMSLGNFTPTGVEIGGHVVARLKRIAASGTAPTNNPWVPMLQLHIECDTVGSRTISDK